MLQRLRLAWMAAFLLAALLLPGVSAGAARAWDDPSEDSSAAYASSAEFDLQPRVPRARFHLRRPDVQHLYDAIAQAFGIRLLFDRDMSAVHVASDFDLEDVTLKEALDAAGNISRTFVAPVDEHTGIVSNDTAEKRGEHERQVLGNFQVEDQVTPQQMTEIGTALRSLLDLRRVSPDARSNSITVLGRARQVEAAREFLGDVQKSRGEVMVDMDVLEIDVQRARELGVLPPQPFQLLFLGLQGVTPAPVSVLRAGAALFGVQLPGASVALTYSSSATRSVQQLHLRSQDGEEAKLLVGERIPILNGIVSTAAVTTPGTQPTVPGVFPSIQYEDVGVTVKATPYLHAGRELTLKLDMAVKAVTGQILNGTPIISNRQVTEQIRVRDGEAYVIGGLLSRERDQSVNGYPGLVRLPLVGALFGTHQKDESETELLFVIRPRILRQSVAEEYASNSIYFGKELQGLPPEPAPSPEQPAAAPAPTQTVPRPGQPQPFQFPFPGQPQQPGVQPQPGFPNQPGVFPPGQQPQPFFPGVLPGAPQPNQPQPFNPGIAPGVQPPQPAQPFPPPQAQPQPAQPEPPPQQQ